MNNWIKKTNLSHKHRYFLLLLSFVIILLDQITKHVVRKNLHLYELRPVISHFWNWTLAYNRGAAFSFLASYQGNWPKVFFGLVALVVAVWIIHYVLSKSYSRLTGICMSFILGGAIGNLVDRIVYGRVTDFIQWYYKTYYWPAFNLADSFICIGVVLLIIEGIFFAKGEKKGN